MNRCPRCQGLIVVDLLPMSDEADVAALSRCMNCGAVHDAVILAHQRHRPEPSRKVTLPVYDSAKHRHVWDE